MSNLLHNCSQPSHGNKSILKRRLFTIAEKLSTNLKENKTSHLPLPLNLRCPQLFHYLLIIDFEATCVENRPLNYKPEIIEFPLIIYNVHEDCIVNIFHSYCRPIINSQLSAFCTNLTGITQQMVNSAPQFPQVLENVEKFLISHNLLIKNQKTSHLLQPGIGLVCDNKADMSKFLRLQCQWNQLPMPKWTRQWINVKNHFHKHYNMDNSSTLSMGIRGMFACLKETLAGRQHCGLDDAKNILRLTQFLLNDGCLLFINEQINLNKPPDFCENLSKSKSLRKFHRSIASGNNEVEEEDNDEDDEG